MTHRVFLSQASISEPQYWKKQADTNQYILPNDSGPSSAIGRPEMFFVLGTSRLNGNTITRYFV